MKRINIELIAGIGYICLFIGASISLVGQYTEKVIYQYQWYDPILIGIAFLVPFVLGWLAHEEHVRPTKTKNT